MNDTGKRVVPQDINDIMNKKIMDNSTSMLDFIEDKMDYVPNQLNVNIFNEVFRSYFEGGNKLPVNQREYVYNLWVNKASGGPNYPVDLVDDEGVILIRVPPLLDMANISSDNAAEFGLMMVMNELEAVNLPHIAEIKADRAISELRFDKAPLEVKPWIEFSSWLKGDEEKEVVDDSRVDETEEEMDDVMSQLFGG